MAKTPHILFVDQSGQLGGAELCLADIAAAWSGRCNVVLLSEGPFREYLEQRGVAVSLVAFDPKTASLGKGAGILAGLRALPGIWRVIRGVWKAAETVDLIYANTAKAAVISAIAARLAKKPLVVHLHDILSSEHFSKINRTVLVRAANSASLVIANSAATAAAYRKAGGRNPSLVVIPNGFDTRQFSEASTESREKIRSDFRLNGRFIVGVFGRLSPWKGQHLLLEAVRSMENVGVVIVGDALFTNEDRSYRDSLHRLAESPDLAGRVHFTGFREDIHSLMQAVDVVAHTSTAPEPFGRVVVEAMLAGRPIVAPNIGGPSEILTNGITGLLIHPADSVALRQALIRLEADPELRKSLGAAAHAVAVADYDIDRVNKKLSTALNRVLEA